MSRRPAEKRSSTLFPFLAVLICTMGALILVLLSMTDQLRKDAENKARAKALKLLAKPAAPSAPEPAVTPDKDVDAELEARLEAELVRRLDAWRQRVAETEAERKEHEQQLVERRTALSAAEQLELLARAELASVDAQSKTAKTDAQHLASTAKSLSDRQAAIEGQVLKTKQNLEDLRRRQATAPSRFALVPFDGTSGTVRRPIYIECTGKGLRFVPEGQVLQVEDLEGFTASFNPLLTGAQALVDYWTRKHQQDSEASPSPYVLLLVRPSGTLNYYVARMMLERLKTPFGYELIEEDFPLSEPEPDATARSLLQTAVSQALDAQPALLAAVGRSGRNATSTLGSTQRMPEGPPSEFGDPSPAGSVPARELSASQSSGPRSGVPRGSLADGLAGTNQEFPTEENDRTTGASRPGIAGSIRSGRLGSPPASRGPRPAAFGRETGDEADSRVGDDEPVTAQQTAPRGTARRGTTRPPIAGNQQDAGMPTDRSADRPEAAAAPRKLPWLNTPEPEARPAGQADSRGPSGVPGRERATHLGRDTELEPLPQSPEGWRAPMPPGRDADGPAGSVPPARDAAGDGPSGPVPPARGLRPDDVAATPAGPSRRSVPGQPQGGHRSSRSVSGGRPVSSWSSNGQTIGLEKDIQVHVYADRIVMGEKRPALGIGLGESRERVLDKFSDRVEQLVSEWGDAPRRFHWIPRLRFVIHPGGNQHYERLRGPLRDWGLSTTVEYSLEGLPK